MKVSKLSRWVPLAAVAALLGAAMLTAVFANPSIPVLPPEPPDAATPAVASQRPAATPAPARSSPRPGDHASALPVWLANALSALCAAAILSIFAMMGWLLLRDRLAQQRARLRREASAAPTPAEAAQRVRDALDAGLAELDDAGTDPRRAVIACWVRLEQAAAAAGTPRQVGDTSTDLVARLLASHEISGDVLAAFAGAYRQARFAPRAQVDQTMRDQARTALRVVRDELTAARR